MALMTPQTILVGATGSAGLNPTFAAANSSDTIVGGDSVFLWVKIGGTATTVTIVRQVPSSYNELNNVTTGAVTSQDRVLGPLNAAQGFINPTTGLVTVNYSQTTGVTSAAFIF